MFFDRFIMLCNEKNVKPSRVAIDCDFNKSSITSWKSKYENGEDVTPTGDILKKLANYFSVSVDYLLGRSDERIDDSVLDKVNEIDNDILESSGGNLIWANKMQGARDLGLPLNIIPFPKTKEVPLLGTIACGEPILAAENIEMYVRVDENVPADFALRCKGDSMINSRIYDGDIVYIKQQSDVENGEIAAVLIGDEATLKKVYKYPNKVVLRASNPIYDDFVYTDEQLIDINIIGKAVAFFSVIK